MSQAWISLDASSNTQGLKLDFRLDNVLIESMSLTTEVQHFHYEFDDSAGPHRFEIELSNKLPSQCKVDQDGNIIEDAVAEIKNCCISGVDLGQVFYGQSLYFHDYNGASKPTVGQFYEKMGCNGTVRFDFYSPVYVWLIENL
jgi:hypothetical protein